MFSGKLIKLFKVCRKLTKYKSFATSTKPFDPHIDHAYLFDAGNIEAIKTNISQRKGVGNIELIHNLVNNLAKCTDLSEKQEILQSLENEINKLPNSTHPDIEHIGNEPKIIQKFGTAQEFAFEPKQFAALCKHLNILRTEHLGNFCGTKAYYLFNELAELQNALIRYTVEQLERHNFQLITVPDLLSANVIEACGMNTTSDRNQVFKTDHNLCLSGTSEMALAGYFANKCLHTSEMPVKLMAVSRCYRAETSGLQEERGIYRVHNFTKVEMFSVCEPNKSNEMLEHFREIEIDLFNGLNLHFQLLDMPPCELGAPAYRKYDIEAWMPGKKIYGEISSCSNCTDYQAKRLNIQCDIMNTKMYAHTINGTACAIPRMLIAILENNQNDDGSISIPTVLHKFMKKTTITRTKLMPELKLIKSIRNDLS